MKQHNIIKWIKKGQGMWCTQRECWMVALMPQLDKNKRFSIQSCPQSAMMTLALGLPLWLPYDSMVSTSSTPSTTFPNTTCFPSSLPGHSRSVNQQHTSHINYTKVRSVALPLLHCKCFLMTSVMYTDVTWRMWSEKVSLVTTDLGWRTFRFSMKVLTTVFWLCRWRTGTR